MGMQTLILGRANNWSTSLVFIEDEQAAGRKMSERMRKLGYVVTTVATDAEAMQLLKEDPNTMLLVGDVVTRSVPSHVAHKTRRNVVT